jgi:hypothetical protein
MAYRRSDGDSILSARWLAKNKSALAGAGIPLEIVNSHRTWYYVLQHGDDDCQSGWEAEWLSKELAEKVLAVLTPCVDSAAGYDLIRRLQTAVSTKAGD